MSSRVDSDLEGLLECPFCHRRPVLSEESYHSDRDPSRSYRLHCQEHGGFTTAKYVDVSDAAFHWNVLISNVKVDILTKRHGRG